MPKQLPFSYATINFFSHRTPFVLKKKRLIRQWIEETAENEGRFIGDISYMFGNDEYVLKVNRQFLQHDFLTDIITFDYCEGVQLNGDIVISIDRVRENARLFHVRTEEELHRVIIHGILHLCGYKDKSRKEAARMRYKEDYYLQLFPSNNL